MPYQSKAQMRAFFAKERAGELPAGTAEKWAHETPSIKSLPETVPVRKNQEPRQGPKRGYQENSRV